jgi:hypothetical protein
MCIPRSSVLLIVCLALGACGCGAAATSSTDAPSSSPSSSTSSTGPSEPVSDPAVDESYQVVGAVTEEDMRAYLTALGPMHREIAKANAAAHTMVSLARADDFDSAADYSDRVGWHVAHAGQLAARVTPPELLKDAHRRLVQAFAIGGVAGHRMAADFRTLDQASSIDDLNHHVGPMQKRANRCANAWYAQLAPFLEMTHVPMPAWTHTMMNWD